MKCLCKYDWVKLPRNYPDMGKGLMGYWAKLASHAAFRKGNARYCGHVNSVTPGTWSGGMVGLKSILGVRSREQAFAILRELATLGYLHYTLDPVTKKLTYEIKDWVVKCSGAECLSGTVYATDSYGFLCLPRNITERIYEQDLIFNEADAWLDLWCHTVFRDKGNAFSFLAPAIQYGKYGSVLTLETLGKRWKWEKTKVWRFFQNYCSYFSLHRLPGAYGCVIFNNCYPVKEEFEDPTDKEIMRILELIRIKARNTHTDGTDNERINRFVAWKSRKVVRELEEEYIQEEIQNESENSSDFRDRQNCRVAEIPPIIRAYFSHGRNCKYSRNCIYDCPGMFLGEPESLSFFNMGVLRPLGENPFFDFDTS